MARRSVRLLAALLLLLAACVPPPAATPLLAEPPPLPPFPHEVVWNRSADAELIGDSTRTVLPRVAMRLEVLGSDSLGLRVRCTVCVPAAEGYIARSAVAWEAKSPTEAAGGELVDFVLAVREAAARRDVAALRPVLATRFVHSLGGGEGPLEATSAWEREMYRTLDPLPLLLDRGLAPYGEIWVAPPEHLEQANFRGLRTGFRQERGRWEWVFLVRDGR